MDIRFVVENFLESESIMLVDLHWEAVNKIIIDDLKSSYYSLKRDLESPVDTAVFSFDHDEEVFEINRHLQAFKMVLEYYGHIFDE